MLLDNLENILKPGNYITSNETRQSNEVEKYIDGINSKRYSSQRMVNEYVEESFINKVLDSNGSVQAECLKKIKPNLVTAEVPFEGIYLNILY